MEAKRSRVVDRVTVPEACAGCQWTQDNHPLDYFVRTPSGRLKRVKQTAQDARNTPRVCRAALGQELRACPVVPSVGGHMFGGNAFVIVPGMALPDRCPRRMEHIVLGQEQPKA